MDSRQIGGGDVKVLQQRCQGDETDVLDESVAHAGPFARTERNEIFRFDDFAVADEPRWIERQRLLPVIRADVQLVVVQKHHSPFFDIVTCSIINYINIIDF